MPRTATQLLPSGLSPSVLEFHQVNRASARVADCHRRLGITPTPEYVLLALCASPHRMAHLGYSLEQRARSGRSVEPLGTLFFSGRRDALVDTDSLRSGLRQRLNVAPITGHERALDLSVESGQDSPVERGQADQVVVGDLLVSAQST